MARVQPLRKAVPEERTETDPVLVRLREGENCIVVTGDLYDLRLRDGTLAYWPVYLLDRLYEAGYITIRYAPSTGASLHRFQELPDEDRKRAERLLRNASLETVLEPRRRTNGSKDDEIREVFRGIRNLFFTSPAQGEAVRVAVVLDYAPDLAPGGQHSVSLPTDSTTFVTELLHELSHAPGVLRHDHALLLLCPPGSGGLHPYLADLARLELPAPTEDEIVSALGILGRSSRYRTQLGSDLAPEDVARIMRGLPIHGLVRVLRRASTRGAPLERSHLLEARKEAVLSQSEGTLAELTTTIGWQDVVGLEALKNELKGIVRTLRDGSSCAPRALCLIGPPGSGKSTVAAILGQEAGFTVLSLSEVKSMWVGESERKIRLALRILRDMAPAILFIDEITDVLPNRSESAAQGGDVTMNIFAEILQFAADEGLRGRVCIVAASNTPEKLDPALLDRFSLLIPVLYPQPEEVARLLVLFAHRISGAAVLGFDETHPTIREAASFLFDTSSSPRRCLDIVTRAARLTMGSSLSPEMILQVARDSVVGDLRAVALQTLISVRMTNFGSVYPWHGHPGYRFPPYLDGVVRQDGSVDPDVLEERVSRLLASMRQR